MAEMQARWATRVFKGTLQPGVQAPGTHRTILYGLSAHTFSYLIESDGLQDITDETDRLNTYQATSTSTRMLQ